MERFIYALSLLSPFLYPAIMSILGVNEKYEKGQENPMMIIFIAFTGLLAIVFTVKNLSKYIKRVHPFFYWLPIILTIDFLIEYLFMSGKVLEQAYKAYLIFLIYSVYAMFVGSNLAFGKEYVKTFKYIHLITIVISVGILLSIPESLTTGKIVLGNTNYQEIAYMSAFCVGIFVYRILFKPDFVFPCFIGKPFRYVEIFLAIVMGLNVLLSGGRGGMVLLIVNVLFFVLFYSKKKGKLAKGILYLTTVLVILSSILAVVIANNDELSTLYEYGSERAFSYVSDSGGIDMQGTGGRDWVFSDAIKNIKENPFGFGFFRSYGLFVYPHNFFLEILLDGGILYFTFMIVFFIYLYNKLKSILKQSTDFYCFLPVLTYPLIILLFSATYKHNCMFWFCVSFIFSYIIPNNRHKALIEIR